MAVLRRRDRGWMVVACLGLVPAGSIGAQSISPGQLTRIDALFAPWAVPGGPGCALGVSYRDRIVLERAWGGAELEHGVAITPATIFEGGSVSKQFTAAAVLLLAQEGRLSLDDDIRRYVPEVPGYGSPIAIRHLIHHTSGLKDWGAVAAIGGWPRGTRAYTHAHVLDIIGRQTTLNHPPGAEYIYSNSNYNLLAIIAERVSGESLAALTKRLIFDPLGMTRTGWRDDFQRLVPGRAQAYGPGPGGAGWRLVMPNENVYGNSSLLTTVGDLLRWSANASHGRVGGAAFLDEQHRRGVLSTGDTISYAGGVQLLAYRGAREISHTGATAGYRAFLGRFPESGWAIAVLCNAANAPPTPLGRGVLDALLDRAATPAQAPTLALASAPPPSAPLTDFVGRYYSTEADAGLEAAIEQGRLVLYGRPVRRLALVPAGGDQFAAGGGRIEFTRDPAGRVNGFRYSVERARNVRFVRQGP